MKKISYFALLVAVVTLFASCAKTELAEPNSNTEKTVSAEKNAGLIGSGIKASDMLAMLKKQNKIISVTKKFTDKETGITGTLYLINNNGKKEEWLYTDKKLENKGLWPWFRSIVISTDWAIHCSGDEDTNCFGGYNRTLIWNN